MKYLGLICLLTVFGCANSRTPSSVTGPNTAYDSMALGNIEAHATKYTDAQNVCFDVKLSMKGTAQAQDATPGNWNLAWVDQADKVHFLTVTQRDPASAPQGGRVAAQYGEFQQWTNDFKACTKDARLTEVKSLILSPKNIPYKKDDELRLIWQ